jgi:hypothetical protein
MLTTFVLTALIASSLYLVRSRSSLLVSLWREASWWEKAILCLAVMPIPGPIDEVAGVVVARRVMKRRSQ